MNISMSDVTGIIKHSNLSYRLGYVTPKSQAADSLARDDPEVQLMGIVHT